MTRLTRWLDTPLLTIGQKEITLGDVFIIPALLIVGYLIAIWLVHKLAAIMVKKGVNQDVVHITRRITFFLALVVLLFTTLELLAVPLTAFAFLSGAIAIGVGFGAQNIINNFISGWILMWERPIRIGDFLEIENAQGKVEAINTRSTRIRRIDGVHLLVPNSKLLENTVINWTLVDKQARTSVRVGVAYGANCEQVRQILQTLIDNHSDILRDPPSHVFFEDFGDNALIFEAVFWVDASMERGLRRVRSDIRFAIDDAFSDAGITIAYPQRDVHLDGHLYVHSGTSEEKI